MENGVVLTEAVGAYGLLGHRLVLESHVFAVSVSAELVYVREVLKE